MKNIKRTIIAIGCSLVMATSTLATTVSADRWVGNTTNGYKYQYDNGTYASKGWLEVGGQKYYIQSDGTRKTGWLETTSGNKYYFDKKGVMVTGWLTITKSDGTKSKYYFDGDGRMTTGTMRKGNKTYYFYEDGRLYKTVTKKTKKTIVTHTTTSITYEEEDANGNVTYIDGGTTESTETRYE